MQRTRFSVKHIKFGLKTKIAWMIFAQRILSNEYVGHDKSRKHAWGRNSI